MIALAVDLCNSVAVTLFGITLSAAFCNIHWTPKTKKRMLLYTLMIFFLSGIAYLGVDPGFGRYLYPLHTHLPLVLALCSLSHERLWPVISVLTAYLCCQLRRWLALIAVAIFSGGDTMQYAVEIIVTVPLLILLLKAAPAIRSVSQYSRAVQCQFGIVPAVYYAFDYATRVYTDLLFSGSAVVVEFMPFVCSAAYLLFLIHISKEQHARLRLEELKSNLDLQVHQAVREIEALRISQQKTRAYRHDLRHHLQYITACIENEQYEQALQYIHSISEEIEASRVTVYCENEAANLILSSFADRAKAQGIPLRCMPCCPISCRLPRATCACCSPTRLRMRFTHAASARTAFPDTSRCRHTKKPESSSCRLSTTARSRCSSATACRSPTAPDTASACTAFAASSSDTAVYTAFRSGISSLSCEFHFNNRIRKNALFSQSVFL